MLRRGTVSVGRLRDLDAVEARCPRGVAYDETLLDAVCGESAGDAAADASGSAGDRQHQACPYRRSTASRTTSRPSRTIAAR